MYSWVVFVLLAVVPTIYAQALSDCQIHKERMQKSTALVKWDITCSANGDYEMQQCTSSTPTWCACYTKDGNLMTQPSRRIKSCTCIGDKDSKEKSGADTCSIPKCQTSGKYEKKQCCPTTGKCHCVDENTGRQTKEPKTGDITC